MSGRKIFEIYCIYILFFRIRKFEGVCLCSSFVSYVDLVVFRLVEINFMYVWIIFVIKEFKFFIFVRLF